MAFWHGNGATVTTRMYYDFMDSHVAIALPGGMHGRWRLALDRRFIPPWALLCWRQLILAASVYFVQALCTLPHPIKLFGRELRCCALHCFTLPSHYSLSSDMANSRSGPNHGTPWQQNAPPWSWRLDPHTGKDPGRASLPGGLCE